MTKDSSASHTETFWARKLKTARAIYMQAIAAYLLATGAVWAAVGWSIRGQWDASEKLEESIREHSDETWGRMTPDEQTAWLANEDRKMRWEGQRVAVRH